MWPDVVVVVVPFDQRSLRTWATEENSVSFGHAPRSRPMKDSAKAFCCGFPWCDAVPVDALILLPAPDRRAGELSPVVGSTRRWRPLPG